MRREDVHISSHYLDSSYRVILFPFNLLHNCRHGDLLVSEPTVSGQCIKRRGAALSFALSPRRPVGMASCWTGMGSSRACPSQNSTQAATLCWR